MGCQVGYVPFDYQILRWAAKWDWKGQAVPMNSAILPDLIPPAHTLGEITRDAAEATGIPAGLRLIAAAADKACEVIGSGSMEVISLIPPYPAAVPGAYSLEMSVYRGYWMVS